MAFVLNRRRSAHGAGSAAPAARRQRCRGRRCARRARRRGAILGSDRLADRRRCCAPAGRRRYPHRRRAAGGSVAGRRGGVRRAAGVPGRPVHRLRRLLDALPAQRDRRRRAADRSAPRGGHRCCRSHRRLGRGVVRFVPKLSERLSFEASDKIGGRFGEWLESAGSAVLATAGLNPERLAEALGARPAQGGDRRPPGGGDSGAVPLCHRQPPARRCPACARGRSRPLHRLRHLCRCSAPPARSPPGQARLSWSSQRSAHPSLRCAHRRPAKRPRSGGSPAMPSSEHSLPLC